MATTQWVSIAHKPCDLIGLDVALLEKRIYPAELLPDTSGYQVAAYKCTADIACNLAGIPCQWAYTAPDCNRFVME